MRSTLLSLLSLVLAGCTFAPGAPWATLEIELHARFDPAARTTDGLLATATDYRVQLDALRIDLDEVRLTFADDSAPLAFDEANPPEGYTLCHGGHCHHDDGRLVDYEDIARELAGGSAEAPGITIPVGETLELDAVGQAVSLDCGDCALPATRIDDVRLVMGALHLEGTVFDARGDRLPEEGAPVELRYTTPFEAKVEIEAETGPYASPRLAIALDYSLPVQVLDLDWADPDPEENYLELFAFDEESLVAEIER